jgi:uncharacterized protein YkwD
MTRERRQRTRALLIIYLLLALLMAAAICVQHAWAADETGRFLVLLNNYRAAASLSPVVADTRLTAAASWMAADVLTHCALPVGPCSHTDSLGRPLPARLTASGFPSGLWEAENLAWQSYNGLTTAEQVFATWRGSAEDNGNMLDVKAGLAGVGRACDAAGTCVWVLDLTGAVLPPVVASAATVPATIPVTIPATTTTGGRATPTPVVPEPTPAVLFGSGLVVGFWWLRTRRR